MNINRFIYLLLIVIAIITISMYLTINGIGNTPYSIKYLSQWVIYSSYLISKPIFSSMVPAVVNAVIWDYRGIDTFFETSVFYIAIISSIALFREISSGSIKKYRYLDHGLSKIVKTVTKLLLVIALGASIAITLHGHLTPGGGFQAGSILAASLLILIIVFSTHFIQTRGLTKNSVIIIRSIGLLGLVIMVFTPILLYLISNNYGFIFQNQAKVMSSLSFTYITNGYILSAIVPLLNIFEFIAISAGFLIIFILISMETEEGMRK